MTEVVETPRKRQRLTWTDEMQQIIRDQAGTKTDAQIATFLDTTGVSVKASSVRAQRAKLGIRKSPGRGVCKVVE